MVERATISSRLDQLGGPEPQINSANWIHELLGLSAPESVAGSIASPSPSATGITPAAPGNPTPTAGIPKGAIDPDRTAAQEVHKLGGTVTIVVDGQGTVSIGASDALPATKLIVQGIDLTKCSAVTDDTLRLFTPLAKLERLILDGTSVGDEGLLHLKELIGLRELFLDDTRRITDRGLAALSGMTNLTELRLKRQQLTDAGLIRLQTLTSLEKLRIAYNTAVTDMGLPALSKLPALRYVNAVGTAITPAGAAATKSGLKITLQ